MGADDSDDGASGTRGPRNKITRISETYDLDDLGEELERRWLGEDRERQSLRDLADYVNKRVLREAMYRAGMYPIEGEVENYYSLLTDDDVTSGTRTEVRNTLDRSGVDAEAVEDDFVSHQSVFTYLKKHRGVEREEPDDEERLNNARDAIERLRNRLVAVTSRTIENFRSTDRIDIGSFDVIVDVNIVCYDCGNQYGLVDLLERRSCDCNSDEE